MNKREKAIWTLVTSLSLLILVIFTDWVYTGFFSNSTYNQFKNNSTDLDTEQKGATNLKNEMNKSRQYEILSNEDTEIIKLMKSYDLNTEEILAESMSPDKNSETKSFEHKFMEHYKNKSARSSEIIGFSLTDSSIQAGIHFLTEIYGKPVPNCTPQRITKTEKEISIFKNKNKPIGSTFNTKRMNNSVSNDICNNNSDNMLYITDDGKLFYNSKTEIYGFQFNIRGAKISNINLIDSILDDFIILSDDKSVVAFTKGAPIQRGCGEIFNFDLSKNAVGLSNIEMNDKDKFYDLAILEKYKSYNESILEYINYIYSELSASKNLEIYIGSNQEIDEYAFNISCFKCNIVPSKENLNQLEIARSRLEQKSFYFDQSMNDPSDLSNIVNFAGQGFNQGKNLRTVSPTLYIQDESGLSIGSVRYQGEIIRNVTLGSIVGDYKIIEMSDAYFLGENIKNNYIIDTLRFGN